MGQPRRQIQRAGLLGSALLSAFALTSCLPVLPATVTSVTGTLTPYNPTLSSSGIPAEQVDFTISPNGPFECTVRVSNGGKVVGSTFATFGEPQGNPSSVQESVDVSITGDTFQGSPSDASVTCFPTTSAPVPPTTVP